MRQLTVFALLAVISGNLLGSTKTKTKPPEPETVAPKNSQFELEKGLLDTLYRGSVTESSKEFRPGARALSVTPQLSFVNASQFILSNNYWEVPYTEQLGGVPAFSLHVSNPLAYWGGLSFAIKGAVGYSYKEAVLSPVHKQTGKDSRAILTLHWLPVSLGTRIEYRISGVDFVRPHLDLEGGAQWLYQSGKLDGIEQGFWVPFYQVAFGLTLFAPNQSQGDWFGGINLGATVRNSFASQQNIRNWSMDVGLNLYL